MGCPYCYLAARLRSPCPCTFYQTAGSFNPALAPIFSLSTRTNSEGDIKTTERETEKIRAGGWEMGVKDAQSLNDFERLSRLRYPYFYFSYPMSPILYFGAKTLPQVPLPQPFTAADYEGMRPAWGQLHPEMTSPLRRERINLKADEPRKEEHHSSVTTTEREKTQNVKTHNHENAWGGPTYTELITEAILSTPEHRMTLSQIYDWITENVEYFRERKYHTSARGWKVSQRLNTIFQFPYFIL